MAKVALGWLGWSEHQTLYSDMNAIHIAYDGLLEKLRAIHGDGSQTPDGKPGGDPAKRPGRVLPLHAGDAPKRLTPDAFDAAFGRPGKVITIPTPFKKGRS